MSNKTRVLVCMLTVAAATVLAGCGGGDGDSVGDNTVVTEDSTGKVPSSAMSSVQAFVDFVGGLAPADHAEPLSLDGTVPPTSDTIEPMSVS